MLIIMRHCKERSYRTIPEPNITDLWLIYCNIIFISISQLESSPPSLADLKQNSFDVDARLGLQSKSLDYNLDSFLNYIWDIAISITNNILQN